MAEKVQEVRETTTTDGNTTQKSTEVLESDTAGGVLGRIIWFIASIIIGLLLFRFLLLLFGANPNNGFADFIYSVSQPFAAPFFGLFNYDGEITNRSYFEASTLIAIIVYTLVASLLVRLFAGNRR